jgi:hypothetical protein
VDHDLAMSQGGVTGKRTFSYGEARALLPRVRALTEEAYRRVQDIEAAPPAEGRAETDRAVAEWARAIMELGLEVKGLWLVDFDSGSGYYCWRHPEEDLLYFHSYEEGFRGRMRIQ